jgi:transposase
MRRVEVDNKSRRTMKQNRFTDDFKRTLVTLHKEGKTLRELQEAYGVSSSALCHWIRQFSEVKLDDDTIVTAQQIKALQRHNAQLEEENLILKKAIATFTPHSGKE